MAADSRSQSGSTGSGISAWVTEATVMICGLSGAGMAVLSFGFRVAAGEVGVKGLLSAAPETQGSKLSLSLSLLTNLFRGKTLHKISEIFRQQ